MIRNHLPDRTKSNKKIDSNIRMQRKSIEIKNNFQNQLQAITVDLHQ